MKNKKIVVGMSGGIDSSVSLILLKEQGYEPIGVSLKMPVWENPVNQLRENVCCTKESLETAEEICDNLNVPFYIYDVQAEFQREVIDYFIEEYKNERTPNPCFICNRFLKFEKLFEFAKKEKIEKIATGHYAVIKDVSNQSALFKAKDDKKDQTYYLAFLKKEWLKNIVFPLGNLLKTETFQIAEQNGLDHLLCKKESQDFCFVDGKSLKPFLEEKVGIQNGKIIHESGKVLGEHNGIHFYTIGQRKGLQTSLNTPLYVSKLDKKNNIVFVTDNPDDLLSQKFFVTRMNWLSDFSSENPSNIQVQVRYNSYPLPVSNIDFKENKLCVMLKEPHRAITPGQSAVFYKDNKVLGGGIIVK
jgi:tRNA-specific 2-thiouridylase